MVSRTEFLSHRYGKTIGNTNAESINHEINGAGRAHRRQCRNTQTLTHNDGVHHIVKLLKQKSQQHRNCKT